MILGDRAMSRIGGRAHALPVERPIAEAGDLVKLANTPTPTREETSP